MDSNLYPGQVVGALNSNSYVLVRTKPVIRVDSLLQYLLPGTLVWKSCPNWTSPSRATLRTRPMLTRGFFFSRTCSNVKQGVLSFEAGDTNCDEVRVRRRASGRTSYGGSRPERSSASLMRSACRSYSIKWLGSIWRSARGHQWAQF
jgi:hypothetical protein